jgi:hypothetical protein
VKPNRIYFARFDQELLWAAGCALLSLGVGGHFWLGGVFLWFVAGINLVLAYLVAERDH